MKTHRLTQPVLINKCELYPGPTHRSPLALPPYAACLVVAVLLAGGAVVRVAHGVVHDVAAVVHAAHVAMLQPRTTCCGTLQSVHMDI